MRSKLPPSISVRSALIKLGHDIKAARIRRRISANLMAERCGVSRQTLYSLENGKPEVSIASYAAALRVLGLLDNLRDAADISKDAVGQALAEADLAKRVVKRKDDPLWPNL